MITVGSEVTRGDKRGVVCQTYARTQAADVMWIGGLYPVREDVAELVEV